MLIMRTSTLRNYHSVACPTNFILLQIAKISHRSSLNTVITGQLSRLGLHHFL